MPFSHCEYYVKPTLCQICKKHQITIIHGRMVALSQLYLKVVKNINSDAIFVWYTRLYCDIKFRALFPSFTLNFLKVAFESLRKMRSEKLESITACNIPKGTGPF